MCTDLIIITPLSFLLDTLLQSRSVHSRPYRAPFPCSKFYKRTSTHSDEELVGGYSNRFSISYVARDQPGHLPHTFVHTFATPAVPFLSILGFILHRGSYIASGPYSSPRHVRSEVTGTPISSPPFLAVCGDLEEGERLMSTDTNDHDPHTWTTQTAQLRDELPNIISRWIGLGRCQNRVLFVLHDVHTFSL
jgi:hypothetical protein